ncbi:MAG TPA: hypothetical protein PLV68_21485, partial [Ilumatobacteraceae bacterium]|nr:hypothetical protein [Ilumatobacteraceae bacterium]
MRSVLINQAANASRRSATHRWRTVVTSAAVATVTALAWGGVAEAAPAATVAPRPANEVPAETTITLPLFGAPLTIDVTAAPGGAISSVSIDPADGFVASVAKPKKVVFTDSANGASVSVSTKHGGEKVQARAGSLTDILGPGTWSGDLFGTGSSTTVSFEIAAADDGGPTITNVTTSDPGAVIGDLQRHTGEKGWGWNDKGGTFSSASVQIGFTDGLQSRRLVIRASTGNRGEQTSAKVSVSLGDIRGRVVELAEAVGPHTWTGTLCNGSTASITYAVADDGTLTAVTADPATATVTLDRDATGAKITFSATEAVRIKVKAKGDGGTVRVSVDERIRCEAGTPVVNT